MIEQDTPDEKKQLWRGTDRVSQHFHDHIRYFNGHFSFTSLYCSLDEATTNLRNYPIYTFQAHGQIYHNLRSFGRTSDPEWSPGHLELYFFDDDVNLDHHMRRCRQEAVDLDREVVRIITEIQKGNPYSEQLRSIGQVEDVSDYRITFNTDHHLDQRTYNRPLTSEVAAV